MIIFTTDGAEDTLKMYTSNPERPSAVVAAVNAVDATGPHKTVRQVVGGNLLTTSGIRGMPNWRLITIEEAPSGAIIEAVLQPGRGDEMVVSAVGLREPRAAGAVVSLARVRRGWSARPLRMVVPLDASTLVGAEILATTQDSKPRVPRPLGDELGVIDLDDTRIVVARLGVVTFVLDVVTEPDRAYDVSNARRRWHRSHWVLERLVHTSR